MQPGEWMWADAAYPLYPWCIPPFKKPIDGELTTEQRHFNFFLSTIRIRVEHAIGLLKGRFQSLRELRIQIGSKQKHRWAILWIRCCIVISNLIIRLEGDHPDENWMDFCIRMGLYRADGQMPSVSTDEHNADDSGDDDMSNDGGEMEEIDVPAAGHTLRQNLFDILIANPPRS